MSLSRSKPEFYPGWLLPACLGLKSRGTPFHLVEFGAGDGLNLIADYKERGALLSNAGEDLPSPEGYADSPYPVLSRMGFAEVPAPASDELYAALSRESSGPKLLKCPVVGMPVRAAVNVPARPEQGVLAYNFALTETMTEQAYDAFRAGVGEWLKPWSDVGFWAELEKPRGIDAKVFPDRVDASRLPSRGIESGARELRIHRWREGEFRSAVLGRLAEARGFSVLEGWGFVQPLAPVRPQRVTIEELPRMIRPAK